MVVEIQRRELPAAVENVGVNGYVSEHGIHQPNVTNLHTIGFYITGKIFLRGNKKLGSFGSKQEKNIWKK